MAKKKETDNTAMKALKRDIRAGTLKKLYVFRGEEVYLREHYLGELKKALLPAGLEEFNLHAAQGRECSPEWLEQAADCLPMMSERTLVVVTDCDLFAGGEEGQKKLLRVLQDLPDHCCVVFVYDTIEWKPGKSTKLLRFLKEQEAVVEFQRQTQGDLTDWISRRFKATGHAIDTGDARYLIFLCGELMTVLVSEIGKIAAYAKGARVTREDIDAVAVPRVDAAVFQMTDAITRRDFDKAAGVLADLFHDQQAPVMILSVMAKYLRQLYTARLCLETGEGREKLTELWDIKHPFQAERLMDAARRFSLPWCRHAVRRCAETDLAMKCSGGDGEDLLVGLLMEMSAGRQAIV